MRQAIQKAPASPAAGLMDDILKATDATDWLPQAAKDYKFCPPTPMRGLLDCARREGYDLGKGGCEVQGARGANGGVRWSSGWSAWTGG